MSAEFIIRLVGMVVFCILGVFWGNELGIMANQSPATRLYSVETYTFAVGLVGALFGLVLTPIITIRPIVALKKSLKQLSTQTLFAGVIGLIIGLIISALLAFPLSMLPSPFGKVMPFIGMLLFSYFGMSLFTTRQNDFMGLVNTITGKSGGVVKGSDKVMGVSNWNEGRTILLDTSVIIDGRISDIVRTGFLPGTLLIPRFVLNELQYIADSPDNLRRQRGRRGMEVLSQLQKTPTIPVQISDIDVEGVHEVDDKLIILARQLRCPILTNDYNLNRVAELQGVIILNVNELANSVKSILLPGEAIDLRIIQEGKEQGQGLAYMEDGTMVVVEGGKNYIGEQVLVTVTKVLQTAAGRMVFARPEVKSLPKRKGK
ncbi:MAG: TRAM domain-containing protein [Anaerolineaceae bacterium]|nr:TRAM domain-containing protein [Anaerolineaceae bacterium]